MASWQITYQGYTKALNQLTLGVQQSKLKPLSELEQLGLIHIFEITHTLAWHCLKDFLQYQGEQEVSSSRDATRKAISVKLIQESAIWMEMIASRDQSLHAYNKDKREVIIKLVINQYHTQFCQLYDRLTEINCKDY